MASIASPPRARTHWVRQLAPDGWVATNTLDIVTARPVQTSDNVNFGSVHTPPASVSGETPFWPKVE